MQLEADKQVASGYDLEWSRPVGSHWSQMAILV